MVTMAERMAIIETKVANVEDTVSRMEKKLDSFMDCADNKYATKAELSAVQKTLIIIFTIAGAVFAGIQLLI